MLKFILTVLLIIMVLRSLSRLLMPLMVKQVVKKAQQNMYDQYRQQDTYQNRGEGKIHVDYVPPKKKRFFGSGKMKSNTGDFVDYEEVN